MTGLSLVAGDDDEGIDGLRALGGDDLSLDIDWSDYLGHDDILGILPTPLDRRRTDPVEWDWDAVVVRGRRGVSRRMRRPG